jgi:hypothetical protein
MYKLTPAAYIFTHQYLNTMQQGIQSAHVVAELTLFDQYREDYEMWARHYKTLRILNAGSGEAFFNTYTRFMEIASAYDLPNACFIEPDMYDKMTAFGFIISPRHIDRIEQEQSDLKNLYYGEDVDPDSLPIIDFLSNLRSAK